MELEKESLLSVLHDVGRQAAVLTGPSGEKIVVLRHGGRVIGLFPEGRYDNLLWTHPALREKTSAEAMFSSLDWCNSGGERSWIVPEADFFLPDFPDKKKYHQPRQLDPGNYKMEHDETGVTLCNDLTLHSYRTGDDIALRMAKRISPVGNPLPRDDFRYPQVGFAGYAVRSSLAFTDSQSSFPVGLWHLVQMPLGGEMFVPTYSRVEPEICFGSPLNLSVYSRGFCWRMDAPGEHKIGIGSAGLTGRMGYYMRHGKNASLIVMNFQLNPSAEYADPSGIPGRPDFMIQCCNVSSPRLGDFSEMEYHLPAIGGKTGRTESVDERQVWAFAGPEKSVNLIKELLLGEM